MYWLFIITCQKFATVRRNYLSFQQIPNRLWKWKIMCTEKKLTDQTHRPVQCWSQTSSWLILLWHSLRGHTQLWIVTQFKFLDCSKFSVYDLWFQFTETKHFLLLLLSKITNELLLWSNQGRYNLSCLLIQFITYMYKKQHFIIYLKKPCAETLL